MVVEPVVYGASERPPRGDYRRAGADYTCAQHYAAYTAQDHDTYRRLYARQEALLPGLACATSSSPRCRRWVPGTTFHASMKSMSA